MRVRIYPRVRMLLESSQGKKWGDFKEVTLDWLQEHFKNYWPMCHIKIVGDHMILKEMDQYFYDHYMQFYDHTIFKNGK